MLVNLNYFITFFQEKLQYLCTHWSKPQFKSSWEFIKLHTCCSSGSLHLSSSVTLWEGMQKSLSKDSRTTTTWFHCPFSCYGGLWSADNDILDSTEMFHCPAEYLCLASAAVLFNWQNWMIKPAINWASTMWYHAGALLDQKILILMSPNSGFSGVSHFVLLS